MVKIELNLRIKVITFYFKLSGERTTALNFSGRKSKISFETFVLPILAETQGQRMT